MPKPTLTALRKHPMAVVLLAFKTEEPDVVADYDYEWFDTTEGIDIFTDAANKWAADDVRDYGDLLHVTVRVADTKADPMVLGDINTFGGEDDWRNKVVETITGNPSFIIAPSVARKAPAAQKVTKARKPNKRVAKAVKGEVPKGDEPKPKAAAVKGRKVAAKKAAAKPEPAKSGPKPKVDRAELKRRMEERAAARKSKPTADKNAEAVQAFVAVGRKARKV